MADYYVREEDGTSRYILEDGSGDYLIETGLVRGPPSKFTLAAQANRRRRTPVTQSRLGAPQVVVARTPYLRPVAVTLANQAPQRRRQRIARSRLFPPQVVQAPTPYLRSAREVSVDQTPQQRRQRITRSRLFPPTTVQARTPYLRPVQVTLADLTPQERRQRRLPHSRIFPPSIVRLQPFAPIRRTFVRGRAGPPTSFLRPPTILADIGPPFVPSATVVFPPFSLYGSEVGSGPGNGGEVFNLQLAPTGTSQTATLAANLTTTADALMLTGDGGFPTTGGFVVTIDTESLYIEQIVPGLYLIGYRATGNTTLAAHSIGATVTWNDTYDMAVETENPIAQTFTYDITGTGSTAYNAWLIAFDSSQGYLGAARYPMHVTEFVGVFDVGTGVTGVNKTDGAQPNMVSTTAAVSDDCPAAVANPARLTSTVNVGDVAVLRYTNTEASILTLGPRSGALQAWYGIKRVDAADNDVTLTDPNGIAVDGTINGQFLNPSSIGINPFTGDPTLVAVPYTTETLPGASRTFTHGGLPSPPNFNEKGWPIGVLAVRNETRRVPFWAAYDWSDANYSYNGFGTDTTFVQLVVNQNGIVFGSTPSFALPGSQDIDGPDAVWDDGTYYFGASWYVVLFLTPYLVLGPGFGGGNVVPPTDPPGFPPTVSFPGGTGGAPGPAVVTVPNIEGGSGGGIAPGSPSPSPFSLNNEWEFQS